MKRRRGISLDLGKELEAEERVEKKIEEHYKPEPRKFERQDVNKKPAKHMIYILLALFLFAGWYNLSQIQNLDVIENRVKDNYLVILQKQIQEKVEENYPQVSKQEKEKIKFREYFEARNSVEFLREVYTESNRVKAKYQDDSGKSYFFGHQSYQYLNIYEKRFGNSILGFSTYEVICYLPLIMAIIAGITLFFSLKAKFDIYAGFIAATIFIISPVLIRTNSIGYLSNWSFLVPVAGMILGFFLLLGKWRYSVVLVLGYIFWQSWDSTVLNNPMNEIGYLVIFLTLNSALVLIYKIFKKDGKTGEYIYMLLILLFCALFAVLNRSYEPYFLIAAALTIGAGYYAIKKNLLDFGNSIILPARNEYWHIAYLFAIFLVVILSLIPNYMEEANVVPIMNDAIFDASNYVTDKIETDAKIVTWYINGPLIEYYSNKEVIVDSDDEKGRQTAAKAFLSLNEPDAISELNKLCTGCKQYIFVTEDLLYFLPRIADEAGVEYIGSRIVPSTCKKIKENYVCGNGYVVTEDGPVIQGRKPGLFLSRINGTKKVEELHEQGTAFVLYNIGERTVGFEIHRNLAESMMVKFFMQDDLENFELSGLVEEPSQVLIYEVMQ